MTRLFIFDFFTTIGLSSKLKTLLQGGKPTEPFHTQAVTQYQKAATLLTHNYVIAEYVALATARRFPRKFVLDFITDLLDNPDIKLIWVDELLHQE